MSTHDPVLLVEQILGAFDDLFQRCPLGAPEERLLRQMYANLEHMRSTFIISDPM